MEKQESRFSCCCWRRRDSIDTNKSPVKSKHVTIETTATVDTEVADDGQGKR